jgi:predicted alpha/beta hydrolase
VTSSERAVATASGAALGATFFRPDAAPIAAVLIAPAMGVAQAFYAPLAGWLAGQGFLVATFDYQGIGRSLHGRLRDVTANIFDWARDDCAAMIDELARAAPGLPLLWIGHSLGAQIVALVPAAARDRIARIVSVAAGSGYWRENTPALRRRVWWMWYVVVPLALRLTGYFPGRRLGVVGDLPGPVMVQWRRWCLHPQYAVGVEGDAVRAQFAAVTAPIVSLSFTDDEFMSARNIESLHGFYSSARTQMIRIDPRDVGQARIGHFGFFRAPAEAPLWRRYLLPALAP